MGKIFDDCSQDVHEIVNAMLDRFHPEIVKAGVTFRYLFVETDGVGPALKHHGYPAAAVIKVNSLQARKEGLTDCTVTIDKEWWDGHSTLQQAALIDHELYHVLVAFDDEGKLITDDLERPKVKLRPHDFEVGGFFEIAKRHLNNAEEVAAILNTQKQFVQMNLDFGNWG